jgi:hypothetical protein
VSRNKVQQAATPWSDAARQKAIESLERDIHQVAPSKWMLCDKLLRHHQRQLLQEVQTKATGPRSKFPKELALMETDPEDKTYGAANVTANK